MQNYEDFLVESMNLFFEKYSGQDSFSIQESIRHFSDFTSIEFTSQRQDIRYMLLMNHHEIILMCDCHNPRKIKSMGYKFWEKFIKLNDLGKLSFKSHTGNSKQIKNAIYNLIQEIVLIEERDNHSVDFGCFEVILETPVMLNSEEVNLTMNKIAQILKLLHAINNDLHRGSTVK